MPTLSIIVVSYNTREMTLACLRSVHQQTSQTDYEIIVVDNASTDGSPEAIAREFPDLTLLALDQNLGFAGANNRGAQEASGAFLLLLNPDTIVREGTIDRLIAFAEHEPEAGVWGGRTIFEDGSSNPTACWGRQTYWSLFCTGFGLTATLGKVWSFFAPEFIDRHRGNGVHRVDIVSGCFLLITRDLWESLGGFDLKFFMYGEEADLCLRARAQGARPMVTDGATIVHHGGASERVQADKLVRLLTAKVELARRHLGPLGAWWSRWMYAQHALIRWMTWSLLGALGKRGARDHARTWADVFSRRGQWMSGQYDAPPVAGATPAGEHGS